MEQVKEDLTHSPTPTPHYLTPLYIITSIELFIENRMEQVKEDLKEEMRQMEGRCTTDN